MQTKRYSNILSCALLMGVLALALAGCQQVLTLSEPTSVSAARTPLGTSEGQSILGSPSLSASQIDDILQGSPMAGLGSLFVSLSTQTGIDDVWTLAIAHHESGFGVTGEAHLSKSPGNVRCLDQEHYGDLAPQCRDNFAWFPSWHNGLIAMYRLLAGPLYVQAGYTTIQRIITRWAPPTDNNDDQAYVSGVLADVAAWRKAA